MAFSVIRYKKTNSCDKQPIFVMMQSEDARYLDPSLNNQNIISFGNNICS